jgi:energy-coupling factor transporter ATP-binding protein EcfA2
MLNKLYQCLEADRIPRKIRKLVVVGPRDSGKTSWAAIFRRIIPLDKIASITYENQFSTAMINDETQIVIIDEWSEMKPNLAKSLLQGGWMVGAVKHKSPRFINNNSPFYLLYHYK